MSGYTKLFNSILASTIWRASDTTRIVWITLLAMSDKDGICEGSIPGLADLAHVSVEDCETALAELAAPDTYSRTSEHEGRRIETIDGVGWQLLNHAKYRMKMSEDERREYNRKKQAEHRAKQKEAVNECQTESMTVNDSQSQSAMSAHTDTDTDSEADKEKPSEAASPLVAKESEGKTILISQVLSGIKKELGLKRHSPGQERDWANYAGLAFDNGFTASEFLECFTLLRKQKWRTGAVSADQVSKNLSELPKLRLDGKQNNPKLQTASEKIAADDEVRKNRVPRMPKPGSADTETLKGN